ncbi:MAG: MTAP family purine nucleoside phosphorylase [Alphaproteobacteria bacterium]|nr:MTAP family purine nucleoside phosphorylase [Alphaproteobacteria bacterium]
MLAIIGGSGLYALDELEIIKEHDITTPFGKPSAPVVEGKAFGSNVLFLPRHGRHHEFLPSEVNFRANIYALKSLGARTVLSISASGSLQEEIAPGDLALASQYFDHTRGKREASFFGKGVTAHISTATPTCPALTQDVLKAANDIGLKLHSDKTYACVEGPRLGTKAESFFLRGAAGCDVVGMTNVPEAFLAREAQMGYVTLAIATDYDCWREDPDEHVSVEAVFAVYFENIEKIKKLVLKLLENGISETPENIRTALKGAVMTPDDRLSDTQKEWLKVLRS